MTSPRFLALALALALAGTACVEENPTDLGGPLLSGQDVHTFEVVLPAADFLVDDSAFSGYVTPIEANFAVVARGFENAVDANTFYRFSLPPRTIVVRTTGSTLVTDSAPRFVSGRVVVRFDTTTSTSRPVTMSLFRTAEAWEASATWTHRVDTSGVRLAWSTPGGTRGAQIDTATWAAGDSVVFDVDSATLALWNDSTNHARGAILVAETGGSRVRVSGTVVRVDAKSSIRADTTVNVDLVPSIRTFGYTPKLSTPFSGVRLGGVDAWRTFLRFRTDLRARRLAIPCTPGGDPFLTQCSVSLDSVHLNTAQLLLKPVASPLGFVPEDSLFVEARSVALAPQIPLERSAIGERLALTRLLPPELFRSPAAADIVRLNITQFVVHHLDESIADANRLSPLLAIMQVPAGGTFGFASFEAEPSLRLVITTRLPRTQ